MATLTAVAQDGGIKGRVVSRNGRTGISNARVVVGETGQSVTTDKDGYFTISGMNRGDYMLTVASPEFENLDLPIKVGNDIKDLNQVVIVPRAMGQVDETIFAELDTDSSSSDTQALPSLLASSKDVYNGIASYRFSEMRFNTRGYDSPNTDVYLNGIRFNDALTGYGPWSLWSGMNDVTRNQENTTGLAMSEYGVGGINGMTNINARASQMQKGFRASLASGNSMYRLRAIVSYASGALDSGWSYAFSFSTRQGHNGYVDGVYYNSYGYFAAVEKKFCDRHRLSLMVLGTPQERGAQQASTEEAYLMYGSNYYNPNVGEQAGKERNTRVRNSHEPIVMLNYDFDISSKTKLKIATSVRFGENGYSALTWREGSDPRPDYYRYMPSYYLSQIHDDVPGIYSATSASEVESLTAAAIDAAVTWKSHDGKVEFDHMYNSNLREDPTVTFRTGYRSNYMIEERHTDQIDYNFIANIKHEFNRNHNLYAGLKARINRTEYYDEVKDLMGGEYWLDIDKFAERDMSNNVIAYQNDVDYFLANGHAKAAEKGDKFGYDYYAHVRQAQLWAQYNYALGGFRMDLGGEIGYVNQWREGLMRKGLFYEGNESYGDSEHMDYLTYKAKVDLSYRFSSAHRISLNGAAMQNAPTFQSSFVSPRTRNQVNPGISAEQIYSGEIVYDLNLPFLKAHVAGYITKMNNGSKVISFYDDTQSSYTNFAMTGIDKLYYGMEIGIQVPIWNGISLHSALNLGKYTYTSNPDFVQIVDNSATIALKDKVYWKDYYVEGTPQTALNVGLNYRSSNYWFVSLDFNYYDRLYLSMNPAYRTEAAVQSYIDVLNNTSATDDAVMWAAKNISDLRKEEQLDSAYTLNLSVGKSWQIHRKYTLGFSVEGKNLLNNKNIQTGGYEQMRLRKTRGSNGTAGSHPSSNYYSRFDSKYFYMYGATYYLNLYFRF